MNRSHSSLLRLASTYSVRDSGLLNPLCEAFRKSAGIEIALTIVGSGQALRLGRSGDADAMVTHDPVRERQFIESGQGARRVEFMTNDFVLAGPMHDPAHAADSTSIYDALTEIHRTESLFISRGDDSGTNERELDLWAVTGHVPFGHRWYTAVPGGMAPCLAAAVERQAYTLTDRGSLLAFAHREALRVVCSDPQVLRNPYSVITVNPQRHPGVNVAAAQAWVEFLCGGEGRSLISNFRIGGDAEAGGTAAAGAHPAVASPTAAIAPFTPSPPTGREESRGAAEPAGKR